MGQLKYHRSCGRIWEDWKELPENEFTPSPPIKTRSKLSTLGLLGIRPPYIDPLYTQDGNLLSLWRGRSTPMLDPEAPILWAYIGLRVQRNAHFGE